MFFLKRVGLRSAFIILILLTVIIFSVYSFINEYIELSSFAILSVAAIVFGIMNVIERANNIKKEKELDFKKAEQSIQRKDWRAAISFFDRILELYPTELKALMGKGYCQRQRVDFEGAVKTYRRAIEIDPKNVDAHFMMGLCYFMGKLYDDAMKTFKKTIEIDPNYTEAFLFIGDLHRIWDNNREAGEYYIRYLEKCEDENIRMTVLEKLESLKQVEVQTVPLKDLQNDEPPIILNDIRQQRAGLFDV